MSEKIEKVEYEEVQDFDLSLLSKSHDKFENIKEVYIDIDVDGETVRRKIDMYKVFSPVGVQACITEFIKNIDYARKVERDLFEDILEPYLLFLLIKHFTTLGDQIPKEFKKQIVVLEQLINTGVLFQIIVHFEEEEIQRVRSELELAIHTFEDNYGIVESLKEVYREKLDDKSLVEW